MATNPKNSLAMLLRKANDMKFTLAFEYIKVTVECKAYDFETYMATSKAFAESLAERGDHTLSFGNFAALDQLVDQAIAIYLAKFPHLAKLIENEVTPDWDPYEDPDWD